MSTVSSVIVKLNVLLLSALALGVGIKTLVARKESESIFIRFLWASPPVEISIKVLLGLEYLYGKNY